MKKLISVFLGICLGCSICVSSVHASAIDSVKALYNLGLAKGDGNGFSVESFELGRCANRTEQAVMIIRLLGKEGKAAWQKNAHPFYDVPEWASDNIGWLYENYVINGVNDTYFGAEETATVKQFATMLLRVLGYSDSNGDFHYDEAVMFAKNLGIIDDQIYLRENLMREDMFVMCYKALGTNLKNSRRKLIDKLCDEGVVDASVAKSCGLMKEYSVSDAFPGVAENLGNINVMTSYNIFKINLSSAVEEYGVRIFVRESDSNSIKEITQDGPIRLQKGEISYNGGRAGYISEITVHGLDTSKEYEFIVIKTTSEGALYEITGKSKPAYNR